MRTSGIDRSGMETPTSMFILMISVLLIFSILDTLPDNEGVDGNLWALRQHQVNSMGAVLGSWDPLGNGEPLILKLSRMEGDAAFTRDSEGISFGLVEGSQLQHQVEEFLSSSPDGLPCVLLVDLMDKSGMNIQGSFVTWSHVIMGRMVVSLFLPLDRGSLIFEGRILI
ncbi:MAG: hypothetical protein ACMUHB_02850 [Thermoplasmatota archaeon]